MDRKTFDQIIENQREAMVDTLRAWVRIDSLKGEPAPQAPFGPKLREMLDRTLADCRKLGFEARDVDGYAGDASLGEG